MPSLSALGFSSSFGVIVVLCVFAYLASRKKRLRYPLPPGPSKAAPILGSLLHLPRRKAWETYKKWGKEYDSNILHVGGAGSNIIILNSINAVADLFEKRSGIYSSRPKFPIVNLMDWGYLASAMVYGDEWRTRRKLFQKHFHPAKPEIHQSGALRSTRERLLPQLLQSPDLWAKICRHAIGTYILSIAYGIKTQPMDDPFVTLSHEAVQTITAAYMSPISYLMYFLPSLQHLPEWCFSSSFRRQVREAKKLAHEFKNAPFDEAKRMINRGTAEASFTSMCLEELPGSEQNSQSKRQEVIKDTAAVFFAGGVDTTVAGIQNFILAMVLHPDKQVKAQEELDRIIGHGTRFPEYEDEQNLPYLSAVLKEVMRWRPWFPQGLPHANDKEDVYNGYYIPKGSIIIPNVWGMMRDEQEYPDAELFRPERFLDSQGKLSKEIRDPASILFGFGRRVCPGMHIGQSTLFILAAHIISVFTIKPAVDEDGVTKEPSQDWPELVACPPLPFECQFIPRSDNTTQLVRAHSED